MEKEITCRLVREIAPLGERNQRGWRKEVTITSWNDGPEKYDIRDWTEDYERRGKGITLTFDEAKALWRALSKEFEK